MRRERNKKKEKREREQEVWVEVIGAMVTRLSNVYII